LARCGGNASAMLAELQRLGFSLQQISEQYRQVRPVSASALLGAYAEERDVFTNLLCIRGEQKRRLRVSLCVIVKNEEHNIGDCLASAAGLFDEVVVLDTGSTDRTKQIALEHGARVFEFRWVDSFSAARNACLEHATGDYIFWLDADDR